MFRIALAFGGVLLAASQAAVADDPVLLKYQFSEDEALIYRSKASTSQVQTVLNMEIVTKFSTEAVGTYTLEKVDDEGQLHVKSETKQFLFEGDLGPQGTYKYDSEAAERERGSEIAEKLNPVFDLLSGAEMSIVLKPTGEVASVQGYEELLKEALENNPLGRQFTAGGTNKAAAINTGERFIRFKAEPVKPGDSWDVEYDTEIPSLGTMSGKQTITFDKIESTENGPMAHLTIASDYSFALDINVGGAEVSGTISTDSTKGQVKFDIDQGKIVSYTREEKMSGTLTLIANGQTFNVPSEMTQKHSSELLSKLPE